MAQVNKISSFKSFTEIKNQETTMKLREENNAKRQETVGKIGAILDEMGLTSLSELEEDKKQALISKMFGNVSEDEAEDIEDEINKLGEPKKLKEGNAFGAAVKKAKEAGETEFEFDGKTYKVEESSVNEGKHGMAKKLLKGIVDGNSSEAEGIKLSKDLADHYLYWISSSPYGKKNENLPLYMLINASFNWGIERGLPKELKPELDALKVSIKQNESFLNEARSISKIQNEWSKVTTEMADLASKWKASEGDAKAELLAQMKEKTAIKKGLESELEAAVAGKDKDLELVVSESVNEAAAKQFDVDFNNMVRNIKAGYGWIDPEYVADTWENSSDSIDFELIKGEIYKRLINAGLLAHADKNDEEKAGKKVKFSELAAYVNESLVNKGKANIKKGSIVIPFASSDGEFIIDTVFKNKDGEVSYTGEFKKTGKKMEYILHKDDKIIKESLVNEAEIKSDDEFKEYAMTVLKKAFGADFDEAKAVEVVDGILKKCDGDYGSCVGMLTSSLGESAVTSTGDNNELDAKDIDSIEDENDEDDNDDDNDDEDDELDEAFDANYWEDYQEGAQKTKNPTAMQIMQEVEAAVEDWNDNNEDGKENEVTPAGEKKVLKLAKEFAKAKGYISFDIIDAMIAQES